MKVKMLRTFASPDAVLSALKEYDLPDTLARSLVEEGMAVAVEVPKTAPQYETASVTPGETTVARRGRPRRTG